MQLHAFFLLKDRPEIYGLPAAPSRGAERVAPSLLSGLAAAAALTVAALGLFSARR
jgi:formate dehydrogenase iron-sulfur subunit